MSDKVVYPAQWLENAEKSLAAESAQPPVEPGGGGPHDPGMDARVTALENDMAGVKSVLARLEPMIIRIDERTNHLATKEDVANVRTDLATKATRVTVWTMGLSVAGLFVAALAAGAVYMPYLATLLRRAG